MSTFTSFTVPSQPVQEGEQAFMPSVICIKPKDWSSEHKTYNLLNGENWQSWRDDILLIFDICSLDSNVNGTLKCPNEVTDTVGTDNWKYNNKYT